MALGDGESDQMGGEDLLGNKVPTLLNDLMDSILHLGGPHISGININGEDSTHGGDITLIASVQNVTVTHA